MTLLAGNDNRRWARVGRRHDSRGETLALLIVWPVLIVAILLMLVHAFIVTNAQAEAELAASQALRSAWRHIADHDVIADPGWTPPAALALYTGAAPHPEMLAAADAARDAAARVAAAEGGWRWWTPGAVELRSDWCAPPPSSGGWTPPDGGSPVLRPGPSEAGWLQVVISGEVYGPLAALWPDRWDRIYSVAQGPAVLTAYAGTDAAGIPARLPPC